MAQTRSGLVCSVTRYYYPFSSFHHNADGTCLLKTAFVNLQDLKELMSFIFPRSWKLMILTLSLPLSCTATGNCVYSSLFDVGCGMDQFRCCCDDNYCSLSQPPPRSSSSHHKYNHQLGQSGCSLPSSPRNVSRLH